MAPSDFRRLALTLEGATEGSHIRSVDFRVGGRIFATLASVKEGYGNLMLTPELQADFVKEAPEVFLPSRVDGVGWGRPMFGSPRPTRICSPAPCAPLGSSSSKPANPKLALANHLPRKVVVQVDKEFFVAYISALGLILSGQTSCAENQTGLDVKPGGS
jgi:hypothetical protein